MRYLRFVLSFTAAVALALSLPWAVQILEGQERAGGGRTIDSLTEPGEGLTIQSTSRLTGQVTFASSQRRGVLLTTDATATAGARALAFVDAYGAAFGLVNRSQLQLQRTPTVDQLGMEHVRFQQVHQGVPVTAGEFVVHLKGARVMAANGHIVTDLPENVTPLFAPDSAQDAARVLLEKIKPEQAVDARYSQPRLEVFNRGLLDEQQFASRLGWFIKASGPELLEYVWVDAQTRAVLQHFSQLAEAKNRTVYTASGTATLPGTLIRSEGGAATGDPDADLAYDYAGITYDYYLANHGRDSFNGAGATIASTVHYCPAGGPCPYQNAFWNGTQMVYGNGFAAGDDVVAHELTHAVTDTSASLYYYMQSGALNESYSDIFGETVDLIDGRGNDTAAVRWKIGEDLSIGAIRDMMTPTLFGDPGKMGDSAQFKCNADSDEGGVHSNSGIPNHAYALMVDGGSYNGRTVTGIGLTKSAKIEYRALTTYLTSGSGFLDNYNALNQSCADLVGTVGITAADCTQVNSALLAVEMPNRWNCTGAVPAPLACPVPGVPVTTFFDNFETATANWTPSSTTATQWASQVFGFAKNGTYMAYGEDPESTSDHRLAMTSAVTIPAGGRLIFDHAFGFEPGFDGGVIEYSTNNGTTWVDAGSLIDAGQAYNRTLSSGSPIAGRLAFSGVSFGYTGTRLNLSSLAGQSVKFRFRIGSDTSVGNLGWVVDNFRIYACGTGTKGPGDYDGDGKADLTVYRPSDGGWYVLRSGTSYSTYGVYFWGASTDIPVRGDFDGDGKADAAVYRPSNGAWYILRSSTGYSTYDVYFWGNPTDVPMAADYDGDGKTDIAVYRPSTGTWYVLQSSTGNTGWVSYVWGGGNDQPIAADFDGDGKADVTVYRPSNGNWYVLKSSTGYTQSANYLFGAPGDIPVPGDYDGDGKGDVAVYRPSNGGWYILTSSTNYTTYGTYIFGVAGDVPVPGDFDGDGKTDVAVFRPSNGGWYVLQSSTGYSGYLSYLWGVSSDIPLLKRQ